jgi:hypothetical protein
MKINAQKTIRIGRIPRMLRPSAQDAAERNKEKKSILNN